MSSTTVSTPPSSGGEPSTPKRTKRIELRDVRHSYGERAALKGVSFDVNEAEIFGLLGPNGSGKTSLFRILSTLMVPSGGAASVCGADVANEPDSVRAQIGVVFQAPSFDKKLTATENLRHHGHLYGLSGKPLESRIAEMLERVGLSERPNDMLDTFSGGMQRRVELAKGLLHRPKVLLLDEPTTGLDPGGRHDLWNYLETLRSSEGVTVLVTTHLMEEAERCDRLAILNEGNLVALGTPAELRSQIGGDVVLLESDDAPALATAIEERFGLKPVVVENSVRLELQQGHKFVTEVVEAFSGSKLKIQSVSVSKPTLEDVFIDITGHKFWTEKPEVKR